MNKTYFIYLTTNKINNKKYIGRHYGTTDDSYLGSGVLLAQAIEKYGKENFSRVVLELCDSKKEAIQKEKKWITKYNAVNSEEFYNLSPGDEQNSGWQLCKEWRIKNPEQAKRHDELAAQHLQEWAKNNPALAQKNTEILLKAAHQWMKDHPQQAQEHMKKVNQAKEKWQQEHPEEHQKQVDKWREAGSITNSKKIRCITTNKIFNSISEAGRYYNTPQGNISKVLQGKRKSAGKDPKTGEKLYWELV